MTELVSQPTLAPTRKVIAAAVAGIIAAALTSWLEKTSETTQWLDFLAVPTVSEAVPVLAALAAAYVVKERRE